MEISAPPNQPQPARRSRRRWWLWVGFLVLAVSVVGGVLVFSKPSGQRFRFLDGATLVEEGEFILSDPFGPATLSVSGNYNSPESFEKVRSLARDELLPLGYIEELGTRIGEGGSNQSVFYFENVSGSSIRLFVEDQAVSIVMTQNRPANFADYTRMWLKEKLPFLTPKPKLEESTTNPL